MIDSINTHGNHDVVEVRLRDKKAVHLYCRDCRVTSPGKVRDMTDREYDESHPQRLSASRFD